MLREEFLQNQVTFLTKLLNDVIIKYPSTRKFIYPRLSKRIEENKEIEKNLDKPGAVLGNTMDEVSEALGHKEESLDPEEDR